MAVLSRIRQMAVPLVIAAALFMENLDSTVISTSLPQIARDLGEDPVILKLAFTAYLLSLAVFIPVSGWMADRFGARHVFRIAIALFTLASAGCGFAHSLGGLVAGRVLQGLGGAMMVPVGRLILLRVTPKSDLVSALSWLTVPALVGPLLGPPLGGFITTYFDWRWIFWINVPFGVLALALASWLIPPRLGTAAARAPLDVAGFFLSGAGSVALVAGASILGRGLVPAAVPPALMAGGVLLLMLYAVHARRAAAPLIDLRLLRLPTFLSSVGGGSLFRISVGAVPFLLPLMLQAGFGLDAFSSGLLTFTAAAGALTMKLTARPILKRFGFRRVLIVNALISAAFLIFNAFFTPATPHAVIMLVLLAGGFFRSLQFTALNAIAYADVPQDAMSRATSFTGAAQQVSLAIGVALAAGVLEVSRESHGGGGLELSDFRAAFFAIAAVTLVASTLHARLAADAGAEVSGHRLVPPRG